MRTSFTVAAIALAAAPLLFIACVGDDSTSPPPTGPDGSSGGTPPGTPPPGPGDDGGASSSGDAGGDADAGPKCGYAGEECCGGGFVPCNPGTVCTSNVCVVNDLVVVGDKISNTLHHNAYSAIYNGVAWTQGPNVGVDSDNYNPYGVWAAAPGQYWAVVGDNSIMERGKLTMYAGGSSPQWLICGVFACADPMATDSQLFTIFGFSTSDIWVTGPKVLKQCSGTTCTSHTTGLPTPYPASAPMTGTSSSDLWLPANDKAYHYDGTSWTPHMNIHAYVMWAHTPTDVWAADSAGLQHWNGTAWSALYNIGGAAPPGFVAAMHGSAADDVWIVGYVNGGGGNTAYSAHWDGASWSLKSMPASAGQMTSVWVASKKEAFAASYNPGGVFKWDGASWTAMTLPVSAGWEQITGSAKPRP